MHIRVKLFAQLRDLVGRGDVVLDVEASGVDAAPHTTPSRVIVKDVWQTLTAAHPALAPFASSVSCAVNAEYARMQAPVQADDEVAFLPPVSGG